MTGEGRMTYRIRWRFFGADLQLVPRFGWQREGACVRWLHLGPVALGFTAVVA